MKTLYLCGGINKLSDSEAKDWREAAKTELAGLYLFLDPMRRDYRGKELESVFQIIQGDLDDMRHSNLLLVNATKPSWGTGMEILYAQRMLHLPVIIVCPEDRPSPWLIGHANKLVKTFKEAFDVLKDIA